MASNLQHLRRINGVAGSPPAASGKEGMIAFNAPGAAGTTGKPAMFFHDGVGWRVVNPDVAVTTQSVTLGAGADVGAAYTAWATTPGNTLTGNVVIATYGTPSQVYVLTNSAAPGTAASWTALGSSYTLPPLGILSLGGIKIGNTYTPGGGKFISGFDADGTAQWTSPPAASSMKGGIALATAVPTTPGNGDSYFITAITTPNAGWTTALTAPVVAAAKVGDLLVYGNSAWHLIPNQTDLTAYVPKAGATTMNADASWTFASAANATIINGGANMPKIDQVTLDMGTY